MRTSNAQTKEAEPQSNGRNKKNWRFRFVTREWSERKHEAARGP